MKRFKVLFGQRRFQLLATMAVLLLAASVVVASGASFTAQSANPGNLYTSGSLTMSNSNDNAAIVTFDKMVPGDTQSGKVTIANTGDVQGDFYLQPVISGDPSLAAALMITIKDDNGPEVYSGPLSGLTAQQDLGLWQAKASHTYTFTVTFPNNDRASDEMGITAGADNLLEGLSATAAFTWTTVNVPTKPAI